MRAPLSWLRDHVDLPDGVPATSVAERLVQAGLEVERVEETGGGVSGIVVGEVLDLVDEPQRNGKTIRWCHVDAGEDGPRGIVCGALNFAVGDRVVVALPGAVLPGGFRIAARKTYGHVSDGMICSARELGLSDDHAGILVLDEGPAPGTDAVQWLGLHDAVLDIAVSADRSYCLSMRGVAREAATALGVGFRDPAAAGAPGVEEGPGHPVRIADRSGCDRYVARTVDGVDPARRSPLWLQRRLWLAGMRPVSLVVDVTNHVMLDTGQPLHAFDADRLRGALVVRRAAAGERLATLDGVDRALDPDDLVIADNDGPVALAGVMGGTRSECHAGTVRVVIEAARFDPASVARTARRHRLPSEASRRFERGVDDALAPCAAEIAVAMLERLAGARRAPGGTDVDHRPPPVTIELPLDLPGRTAGLDYPPEVVRRRLRDVGCALADGPDGSVGSDGPDGSDGSVMVTVTPPSWRPDLRQPADLVEEVVRLEGYDQVPARLPPAPAGRGLTRAQRLRRQVGRALAADGWVEVVCYPFVGDAALDALMLPADDERRRVVRLANPLADDEPYLRTSLLPGLLATLVRNVGRGLPDVALYESGSVFLATPAPATAPLWPGIEERPTDAVLAGLDALLPAQPRHVAAVACGAAEPAGWWGPGRPVTWADAIAAARTVAAAAGVGLDVVASPAAPFHPGRGALLRAGGGAVGQAGELHPRVVAALGLPARTVAMELDLDALLAIDPGVVPAPSVPAYPAVGRDVALVVPPGVPAAAVAAALRAGAGPLLESLRLFDVYAGEQVPAGHRSLAYAMRLRAPDRTLTDEEANAARDAAVAAVAERTGARLRS
ncbi:MAG: phenylalanine--tRNA ligase subunit beta [Frankiaceae bacterium]